MAFDFASYLFELTGRTWTVESLDGGFVNHTVRATLHAPPPDSYDASETSHKPSGNELASSLILSGSLVLKQAPPYVAQFPSIELSQRRQFIEAHALEFLHASSEQSPFGLAHVLHAHPNVCIPRLIHHNEPKHLLIQSDLGRQSRNLDKYLLDQSTLPSSAASVGSGLVRFLVDMHHAYDSDPSMLLPGSEISLTFRNSQSERLVHDLVSHTNEHLKTAGVTDYDLLSQRALDHWDNRRRCVFGQGDVWFGTILVGSDGLVNAPSVGICDWEFAGPSHPAIDVAQLGLSVRLPFTGVPLIDQQGHTSSSWAYRRSLLPKVEVSSPVSRRRFFPPSSLTPLRRSRQSSKGHS
ncbi:hypothetical protein JAAARDRAFT_195794 [Jaapia argillacea MUCL 33604]|uniref:Aminoglycoside phosphotransferase domain-containing protein n=1 Tax=Jaapia argillacea MUCL 33604 TaxID=933084 RepID=A0A067PYM0_9AGAM|nr:hypothetical protein JAAARDRAFT_195794 [Jaapia argillacea MUCL 33604]